MSTASNTRPLHDIQPIADDPTWNTGDFSIISSDNTLFRIPSVSIFSASQVFRDAGDVECGSDKTVHLTDSAFETALTLRGAFHLIMKMELPPSWETQELVVLRQQVANLVAFLQKYQCDTMLQALKLAFHYQFLVTSKKAPFSLAGLVLGSLIDVVQFCVKAIQADSWKQQNHYHDYDYGSRSRSHSDTQDPLNNCQPDSLTLVPCNMPLRVHELIPTSYLWALSRSWSQAGNSKGAWVGLFEKMIMKAKGG